MSRYQDSPSPPPTPPPPPRRESIRRRRRVPLRPIRPQEDSFDASGRQNRDVRWADDENNRAQFGEVSGQPSTPGYEVGYQELPYPMRLDSSNNVGMNGNFEEPYLNNDRRGERYDSLPAPTTYGVPSKGPPLTGEDDNVPRGLGVWQEDQLSGWLVLQQSLVPIIQELVQTNKQLYELISRGYPVSEARSGERRNDTVEGARDAWDIDLEQGEGLRYRNAPISNDPLDDLINDHEPTVDEAESEERLREQPHVILAEEVRMSLPEEQRIIEQPLGPSSLWLVPYGTFLTGDNNLRNQYRSLPAATTSGGDENDSADRNSKNGESQPSVENIESYAAYFQPSEYVSQEDLDAEKRARIDGVQGVLELIHNAIDEAAAFTRHEFCEMEHISALYPIRYNMHCAIQNGDVDVPHLVELCKEVRYSVQEVVLHGWEHISTFVPLIEERLLCCTGDPNLRLDACWDRRLCGTFLDFGWTRAKPDMPPRWSFFAHCKPQTLLSIPVEICEGMNDVSMILSAEWGNSPDDQAWNTITLGSILRGCYARRILIQPQADDFTKYKKHCLYVLAALELMNTSSKA